MEPVSFIHTEDSDDLIVSFAIPGDDPADIISLILLRTPKYEFLLPEGERGVNVSRDDYPEEEDDMLAELEWKEGEVRIVSQRHEYKLNLKGVASDEIKEARRVLEKMNFDGRVKISGRTKT